MKFKNSSGKVFDTINNALWAYCWENKCYKCAMREAKKDGLFCVDLAKSDPIKVAHLLGIEVILEDGDNNNVRAMDVTDTNVGDKMSPLDKATTRASILEAARICVCGDREQDYGSPEDNFRTIANLWIDYLSAKCDPLDIEPQDVASMLALLKIARIATGRGKKDNWIDLAGYAACGGEIEGKVEI